MESVLQPAGFAVVKAYSGRQAIELAVRLRPDLVIVDYKLTDIMGLDACRALRELPTVDDTTPFVITTTDSLNRKERHECFRAGIWDIFSSPFDPVELVGKLEAFLSARRQVEHALESTHKDPWSSPELCVKVNGKLLDASVRLPWRPPSVRRSVRSEVDGVRSRAQ